MRELILLRGLPGAGKTTLAHALAEGKYPVLSVDDYFTTQGKYEFRHLENHLAYAQCQELTRKEMNAGTEKIFVHNTFTMDWEIEPYVAMAGEYNYRLHVMTVERYHKGTNVHEVSEDQIRKMADKYLVKLF